MVWVVGIQEKLVGFLTLCCHLLLKRAFPELHDVNTSNCNHLLAPLGYSSFHYFPLINQDPRSNK